MYKLEDEIDEALDSDETPSRSGGTVRTEQPPEIPHALKPPLEQVRGNLRDAEVSIGRAEAIARHQGDGDGARGIRELKSAVREQRRKFEGDR